MKKLLFLTIIFCSNWAFGQEKATKSFSGNFEGGTATYSYYENANYERIYNGVFSYNANVIKYDGLKINITGNFLDNLRNGIWIFSVKNIKPPVSMSFSVKERAAIQLSIQMYLMYNSPTEEILAMQEVLKKNSLIVYQTYSSILKGNYINGILDGVWTFNEISTGGTEQVMTNEKNTPISSTVSFKNNHLIGDFTYKQDENNIVIGQFDDNGALVGKWITKWVSDGNNYENISEFENGILIRMIEMNASTGEILFRNTKDEGNGRNKMSEAILFWVKGTAEIEFNQLAISRRNYMFKFDKGIIKPNFEYNF